MNWWLRPRDNRNGRSEHLTAVAPSLLSADFTILREDIASMEAAGVDLLHCDVMDAHFVPNLTFGPFICQAIRRCTDLVLDAHLMMTDPARYIDAFADAGVDAITIHVEAESDLAGTLEAIGARGLKRGLSVNPGTPVEVLEPHLSMVDLVLVMTVEPGFGGQSFDARGLDKMRWLAARRADLGLNFAISVDGGVNDVTAPECRAAGADILVSGSWFCKNPDRPTAANLLRGKH